MATLQLPQSLARLFTGMPTEVSAPGTTTVMEALRALDDRYPGAWNRLCESGPRIRRHIVVFVDGERARLDTPVAEGTEILVLPAVSGG